MAKQQDPTGPRQNPNPNPPSRPNPNPPSRPTQSPPPGRGLEEQKGQPRPPKR